MGVFYILNSINICTDLVRIWTLIGYCILIIQIVVPLLLIISGMITMAQAVMKQKDDEIKKAQNLLIKKVIAAVMCFLVITITRAVVGLVVENGNNSDDGWQRCVKCSFNPNEDGCTIKDTD